MSVRRPARLIIASVFSVTLATGSLAAVHAASGDGCSFHDPGGDAKVEKSGSIDDLDLTDVTFGANDDDAVLSATIENLSGDGPDGYAGDDFEFDFTLNNHDFVLGAVRRVDEDLELYLTVDGDDSVDDAPSLNVDFSSDDSRVQATISLDDLSDLAGDNANGAKASGLRVQSLAVSNDDSELPADEADGGNAVWAVGSNGCGSGAGGTKASPGASARPSGSSSQDLLAQPVKDCFLFDDPKDDANPKPRDAYNTGNDPDLDLRSVVVKSPAENVQFFVRVEKLDTKPAFAGYKAHRFGVTFSYNGKSVALSADTAGTATVLVDGTAVAKPKASAAFDTTKSQVVFTLKRADAFDALESDLTDGEELQDVAVTTKVILQNVPQATAAPAPPPPAPNPGAEEEVAADSAVGDDPYELGDNHCFFSKDSASPKPKRSSGSSGSGSGSDDGDSAAAKVTVTAPASVQWSDPATVAVTLKDADGKALGFQAVSARIGAGAIVTGKTDRSGKVTLKPFATDKAGSRVVLVQYAGNDDNEPAEARKNITVTAEKAVLTRTASGTGTTHTVVITLTDDDKKPQAGQVLQVKYDGKTVNLRTDKNGRVSFKAKAGGAISVTYAGRAGYVAPAKLLSKA